MNCLLDGENVTVDLGLDEPDLGVNRIGNRRWFRFATFVQGNYMKFVIISGGHMLGHSETVTKFSLN